MKVNYGPGFAMTRPGALHSLFAVGDTVGRSESAKKTAIDELSKTDGKRRQLYELQAAAADLPEVECPLQHVFAPGAYARTILIPAGTVIVGKIHKHSHLNILSKGEVTVVTEGGGKEFLRGPLTMVSPPGTKRAVYAHTDTVWTTVHLTDETDLGKIEEHVIAKTYEDYEQFKLEEGEAMRKIEVSK